MKVIKKVLKRSQERSENKEKYYLKQEVMRRDEITLLKNMTDYLSKEFKKVAMIKSG